MDDYIQSDAAVEDACKSFLETKHCLQTGGFRLKKFVSNNSQILIQIPPEDKDNQTDIVSVLGRHQCSVSKKFFKNCGNFGKNGTNKLPLK